MQTIYSYDNYEGDKGIIIADSFDEAIELFHKKYPDRQIADDCKQYWDHGCYIEEIDYVRGQSQLYVTCAW